MIILERRACSSCRKHRRTSCSRKRTCCRRYDILVKRHASDRSDKLCLINILYKCGLCYIIWQLSPFYGLSLSNVPIRNWSVCSLLYRCSGRWHSPTLSISLFIIFIWVGLCIITAVPQRPLWQAGTGRWRARQLFDLVAFCAALSQVLSQS